MPMSKEFEERLRRRLPEIVAHFGTPFHIYDELGIISNGGTLKTVFTYIEDFQEFFAVKACPNIRILLLMLKMGFGFDCSSVPELILVRRIGAKPQDIMFTSNNTSEEEYIEAFKDGGCIPNLDDITFIEKVARLGAFPELICFRYNPGERRTGNQFIGNPKEAKYGLRHDQIVEAYRLAKKCGAKIFGLQTMICSNELNYQYQVETVKMLLEIVEMVSRELGIVFEFINIGGGMGIPYRPEQNPFNWWLLARESALLLDLFKEKQGYVPKLFMESGRAMTGPFGVLVTKVINRMSKHREYVGVDADMSALLRAGIYETAYHHVTVYDKNGVPKTMGPKVIVDVVGSLCENMKLAKQRELFEVGPGDLLFIHDTGAHGYAMGFWYNGRLRPKQLLLSASGQVELIQRADTVDDYFRTMFDFKPDVLSL